MGDKKYNMMDYMKMKALLGEILLDCPAKCILSPYSLVHDLLKGIIQIIRGLKNFENSDTVILKIKNIYSEIINREDQYKDQKDPSLYSLWLYGVMCQKTATIFEVLYSFWKDSGSIPVPLPPKVKDEKDEDQ